MNAPFAVRLPRPYAEQHSAYRTFTRRNWFFTAALVLALNWPTGKLWAQSTSWVGNTGSWYNASNWSLLGGTPSSTVGARINNGGTAQVAAGTAEAKDLVLGAGSSHSGTVTVNSSGNLSMSTQTIVGDAGTGTLNIMNGGQMFSGSSGTTLGNAASGVGTVNLSNALWGTGYSLRVGFAGTGTLAITNGGKTFPNATVIGNDPGSIGSVTVDGSDSKLDNIVQIEVANAGSGTLRVTNGALAGGTYAYVADRGSGTGSVVVQGLGSKFQTTYLSMGALGAANMTIADGAVLRIDPFHDGSRRIILGPGGVLNVGLGALSGTVETANIENAGSLRFDHTDTITLASAISGGGDIRKNGSGTTTLTNVAAATGNIASSGGILVLQGNVGSTTFEAASGSTLRLEGSTINLGPSGLIRSLSGSTVEYAGVNVSGGFFRGPGVHRIVSNPSTSQFTGVTVYNSVDLVQEGTATFINFTNAGRLTNSAALTLDGGTNASSGNITINSTISATDFGSDGVLTINSGGKLEQSFANLVAGGGSRTTVNAGGTIDLLVGSQLDLNGGLLVNNGTINGSVNVNYGSLAKGTGTYGVVNVNTGGVYSPGNSPGISTAAAVTLDSTAAGTNGSPVLAIELAGSSPGTQYDQLHVTGQLSLSGTLQVSLINGFVPVAGQTFDILDWGTRSGTFSSIALPSVAGLEWNTTWLYATGVISIGIAGDYNNNGTVDSGDYVVWRKGLGTTYSANDYSVWCANFGQTAGSGGSAVANASVPEPATLVLLMLAAAAGCGPLRRRAKSV